MRISLNAGHPVKGQKGAGAYYDDWYEGDITRIVAKELTKLLKAKGHKVYSSTVDKSTSQNNYLKQVCNLVNNQDVNLFISLHANMSNKHNASGCEIWEYSKSSTTAKNILKNMNKLGFKNRGEKFSKSLYVLKHTKPKALLIELFFMDSAVDRALYKKHKAKKIAEAIASAIE